MTTLKELKTRISSVKSTSKVTKVMKMVAASKLRKAQDHFENVRTPAEMLKNMILNTSKSAATLPKILHQKQEDDNKTHLLLVISSDRGLCGGFNSNLIKLVKSHIADLEAQKKEIKIICIGKKSYQVMARTHCQYIMNFSPFPNKLEFNLIANGLVQDIISMFDQKQFDVCTVFYNKFINALIQRPHKAQIIPFIDTHDDSLLHINEINECCASSSFECEPSGEHILQYLIPKTLSITVYMFLLESFTGEQGARMAAMDNATNNAQDMIKNLTIYYNKCRQAKITTELIEIVSGANALQEQ